MAGFPLLASTQAQKGGEYGGIPLSKHNGLDLILIPVCINLLESDGDKLKERL